MDVYPLPPHWVSENLLSGLVIPAHPLALTSERKLDEAHQHTLTRYYHAAGAGGVAVGVHTTQFEIRQHGLIQPVLQQAINTIQECDRATGRKTVCIAGICGSTPAALAEARFAQKSGYHAGLLSLGALREASEGELIKHCQAVAQEIPLFGFYLQPAAGGRVLPFNFWRKFVEIPNVVAIKIAPFNRYQTQDVLRAVAEAGRSHEIALYTGNDDHIVLDLLTKVVIPISDKILELYIAGGLLGQWAVWTHRAVELLEEIKKYRLQERIPATLLTLAAQITDANAAIFDARNSYAGCIPGIHYILHRQGLMDFTGTLNPDERLSPGQVEEIDRILRIYPSLTDDDFIQQNLNTWFY